MHENTKLSCVLFLQWGLKKHTIVVGIHKYVLSKGFQLSALRHNYSRFFTPKPITKKFKQIDGKNDFAQVTQHLPSVAILIRRSA